MRGGIGRRRRGGGWRCLRRSSRVVLGCNFLVFLKRGLRYICLSLRLVGGVLGVGL